MINLIHGDCMEVMKDYPDNYFDLAIVDPPYGIDVKTRVFDDGKKWDLNTPNSDYFVELFRVSKNQIIWGANYFIENLHSSKCFLIWDKKMTEKHMMSMAEFAWTSFNRKSLIFSQPPVGDRGFYNIDGARIHPTQKSIKLYEWQLSHFSQKGQKILDTHLGSGSSAIAAHYFGVGEFVGVELDEDYFKAASERFDRETKQEALF